ncbi:HhH-GPD family protein [Actibacterium pelagium]|uniref:hypothetical protein n=1 Tax=Actibacterium pelagium TaxID=2029103 RepID=UPI001E3F61B3|nr:hypothetical protein [Actibacterium pelagium]
MRTKLLDWFTENGRGLPWRSSRASTYEKICVEVLLQRTRAETVANFYSAFYSKYPDWGALAATPVEDLEEILKPIGLWKRRAVSLNALAKYAAEHGGLFPSERKRLSKVPAVGQYVANSILLFQHGVPSPLVDVNMSRVLERYLRPRELSDIRHDPWLQDAAHWLVCCNDPARVNWATLDFAAMVCRARNPTCPECPLRLLCNFARKLHGKVAEAS